MTESRTRMRLKLLAGLFAFVFAAITTRLWFLQVLATDEFTDQADQNQVRLVAIEPLRGQILDRDGRVLVDNRGSTVVTVDRQAMAGREDEVLFRLSEVLGVSVSTLLDRLDTKRYAPYEPVPVAEDVPEEVVFYIREHPLLFPGVAYELASLRDYPYESLAAHVLGNVGEISPEELTTMALDGYRPGDVVGQGGVEAVYERFLFGQRGIRSIQVNAQGEVLDREFAVRPAQPGANLVLSIDVPTQQLAEQSLELGMELARETFDEASQTNLRARAGAVVVMDPRNGQVLAMVSNPTYDPRVFQGGLSRREARTLFDDPTDPFLNRAIQGQYPAGSTFKPFVAAGAIRQRFASPDGFYDCPPSYIAPGDTSRTEFENWQAVDRGHITLADALVFSCDTVFYQFGWEYWVRYFRSGKIDEFMQRDLTKMGFGHRTGIDLPGEAPGLIPNDEYKYRYIEANRDVFGDELRFWLPGDNINMSIGQGLSLVTPMQLAMAYSALANGGRLLEPHVGLRVQRGDGTVVHEVRPRGLGRLPISKRNVAFLRQALRGVTERGTAATAFEGFPLDRIPVAGKTGTAEVKPHQDYSWFAAIAPADRPQYVVVALVEEGGHGSTSAAPVVRRILEGLFDLGAGQLQPGGVAD